MAIIGYARVSTTGQSLEQQLIALAECEKVFQEKISGSKTDRPQLQAMLEFVRSGDMLKVTKLDRLARNTRHLLEITDQLHAKGVTLQIQNLGIDTATPTGKLMLTMIGAIATFEREIMLERQAEGIALAKAKGIYKGRKPTAMEKRDEVLRLLSEGATKVSVAKQLGKVRTSIPRTKNENFSHLISMGYQ
ncbi:recombinase family protein [Aeromonas sp. Prich7-2]|uniref:recombinase family protein n=1 Tax=Aeromonas sp. Prich7-2 TaxID=2823361 RepID=UPI001B334CAE|nr:recombinase family protein [Aeromonas sp. Prich7-2]MBP4057692.1 recombinase family protein [Aeromonas sp. Prich7-2]